MSNGNEPEFAGPAEWHPLHGSPCHAWPDWPDQGKTVQIELHDCRRVTGLLVIGDFFPDGQGDEVPVFYVRDSAGVDHSFCDAVRWRFC